MLCDAYFELADNHNVGDKCGTQIYNEFVKRGKLNFVRYCSIQFFSDASSRFAVMLFDLLCDMTMLVIDTNFRILRVHIFFWVLN